MVDGTFALFGGLGCFGGCGGGGFFDGQRLSGFGGWEVVGGFVVGFISFVLVWHGDGESLPSALTTVSGLLMRYWSLSTVPKRAVGEIVPLAQVGLGSRVKGQAEKLGLEAWPRASCTSMCRHLYR